MAGRMPEPTHTLSPTGLSFLSLSHRLEVIANDLETCRNLALALTIERYWDDYVL
jgi:hypothetical protein